MIRTGGQWFASKAKGLYLLYINIYIYIQWKPLIKIIDNIISRVLLLISIDPNISIHIPQLLLSASYCYHEENVCEVIKMNGIHCIIYLFHSDI